MKLILDDQKDILAALTVCNLYSMRSVYNLLQHYCKQVPAGEDFEVEINKKLLPPTYMYNPSLLAQKVQSTVASEFQSSSGSTQTTDQNRIYIILMRNGKAKHQRFNPNPSVKQMIKEWLDLNLDHDEHLDLPLDIIPHFFSTHPEQLAYQVKQETGIRIRIKRLKTLWKISRKS